MYKLTEQKCLTTIRTTGVGSFQFGEEGFGDTVIYAVDKVNDLFGTGFSGLRARRDPLVALVKAIFVGAAVASALLLEDHLGIHQLLLFSVGFHSRDKAREEGEHLDGRKKA